MLYAAVTILSQKPLYKEKLFQLWGGFRKQLYSGFNLKYIGYIFNKNFQFTMALHSFPSAYLLLSSEF